MRNVHKLIMTGLMTAMITVGTMAIMIPIPFTGGYIHAGDSMIFLAVLILGWRYGAFSAGVGSAFADILGGYANWAPFTLVIKALMAVLMGIAIEKCMGKKRNTAILSIVTAAFWLVFNFGVKQIVKFNAAANPKGLISEDLTLSQLPAFLEKVQSQLMLAALIIPVFLIIIAIYIKMKENFFIPVHQILGITLAGLWMVFGYYIAGGLILGNFAVSAFSIPANIIQFSLGFLIAALILVALSKTPAYKYFTYRK